MTLTPWRWILLGESSTNTRRRVNKRGSTIKERERETKKNIQAALLTTTHRLLQHCTVKRTYRTKCTKLVKSHSRGKQNHFTRHVQGLPKNKKQSEKQKNKEALWSQKQGGMWNKTTKITGSQAHRNIWVLLPFFVCFFTSSDVWKVPVNVWAVPLWLTYGFQLQ